MLHRKKSGRDKKGRIVYLNTMFCCIGSDGRNQSWEFNCMLVNSLFHIVQMELIDFLMYFIFWFKMLLE
jgi:hypothetical protein